MTDHDDLRPLGADGRFEKLGQAIADAQKRLPPPDLLADQRRAERHAEAVTASRSTYFAGQIPPRFATATLDDLADGPQAEEARSWVLGNTGQNCVHLGPVGVGKTHAAVGQARAAAVGSGRTVLMVSALELLAQLRPGGDEDLAHQAATVGLLVLDDVGAERGTDWTAEQLAAIIDRRWLDQLPIIATTNLAPGPGGSLEVALGERTYSRLVGSGAVVIQWPESGDRRRSR